MADIVEPRLVNAQVTDNEIIGKLVDGGSEYEVDPEADLRPVCPNCHAVIHLGGMCREIEEVMSLLKSESLRMNK